MISQKTFNLFLSGDEEATQLVFEEYRNLVCFIATTYISNPDDCSDILSITFLKVLENREKINGPKELKQFVCAIAKNESINFLKKDNHLFKTELIDEMYGEEDKTNDVLNLLEPVLTNKEVIVIYYKIIFDYSWNEIVKEAGIPLSTARLIYKKAKEKLKKELRK